MDNNKNQRLDNIIQSSGKYVLVGMNSQGKTYALKELYSNHKDETIYIKNESKADEALKTTVNSSPLVDWLGRLLDINSIQENIDRQIASVNFSNLAQRSNLNISLKNTLQNFKGLVSAEIKTRSNTWEQPGSGETFYGELLLVEQMINCRRNNPIQYLLIDEPETFLHQSLYTGVCTILSHLSQQMCVIISTHSPEFIKTYCSNLSEVIYVRNGNLKQLLPDDEYIKSIRNINIYSLTNNMDRSIRQLMSESIFKRYFTMSIRPKILEYLFCQIAVIGEGIAEQEMFECFKRRYSDDAITGNTSFDIVCGKYLMPAFLTILQDIGVRTVAIFDGDNRKTDPWNRGINESIINLSTKRYIFDEDIEHYFEIIRDHNDNNFKPVTSPMAIQLKYINADCKLMALLEEIKTLVESCVTD